MLRVLLQRMTLSCSVAQSLLCTTTLSFSFPFSFSSLPPFQWKFVFVVDFFLASRRTLRFHAAVCTKHVACCVPSVHVHPIQSESFGSLLLIFLAKAFLYIFGLDIEIPLIAFYMW